MSDRGLENLDPGKYATSIMREMLQADPDAPKIEAQYERIAKEPIHKDITLGHMEAVLIEQGATSDDVFYFKQQAVGWQKSISEMQTNITKTKAGLALSVAALADGVFSLISPGHPIESAVLLVGGLIAGGLSLYWKPIYERGRAEYREMRAQNLVKYVLQPRPQASIKG